MEKKISLSQEVSEIFAPLWTESDWRYAIMMGGRGTGRSHAGSQYDLSHLVAPEYFRGALMRAVHNDIRPSLYRDLCDRIDEQGVRDAIHIKDNDMSFKYGVNTINSHGFKSSSGSHTAKLKSLANYTNVRIEEAKEVGEHEFRVLDDSLRTTKANIRVILQTNPPAKNHWMIQRFFDLEPHPDWPGFYIPHLKKDTEDRVIFIGGNYLDNIENLDRDTIRKYAAYERHDPAYFCQEILGLIPDEVRGKIFRGWSQVEQIPREARFVGFGEDYGWFPDPACIVAIWYCDGTYYIDEVVYGVELDNEYLAAEAKAYCIRHGIEKPIMIADAAEPKSIAAQQKVGIKVLPSLKGADAVDYRIKVTSTKKIAVTKRSPNVWMSYENYAWDQDKDGNPKGVPVHTYSHAMDAVGMFFSWQEGGGKKGGAKVNTPSFKSYGHAQTGKSPSKATVYIPGRK